MGPRHMRECYDGKYPHICVTIHVNTQGTERRYKEFECTANAKSHDNSHVVFQMLFSSNNVVESQHFGTIELEQWGSATKHLLVIRIRLFPRKCLCLRRHAVRQNWSRNWKLMMILSYKRQHLQMIQRIRLIYLRYLFKRSTSCLYEL